MTFDDVYEYISRHDPVPNDDDNVIYQLAEMVYEQLTMEDPTVDDIDNILEKIHDEARTDRCR